MATANEGREEGQTADRQATELLLFVDDADVMMMMMGERTRAYFHHQKVIII